MHPILHLYENIMFIIVLIYVIVYCAVLIFILHMFLICIVFWQMYALFRMWQCCNLIEPLKFQLKEGGLLCMPYSHIPL